MRVPNKRPSERAESSNYTTLFTTRRVTLLVDIFYICDIVGADMDNLTSVILGHAEGDHGFMIAHMQRESPQPLSLNAVVSLEDESESYIISAYAKGLTSPFECNSRLDYITGPITVDWFLNLTASDIKIRKASLHNRLSKFGDGLG